MSNNKNLRKEEKDNAGIRAQDQFRVVINLEAHRSLMALIERVNDGFDAGKIAKSDLVNWLLLHSTKLITDTDVKALRGIHFDERKILGSLLKTAGDQGDLPDEIKKALRDYYGLSEGAKKRTSNLVQNALREQPSG